MPQRRPGIREVLDVRRPRPVLEVGEVGDKGGLREEFLGREVVEVEGVGEGLDELQKPALAFFFCAAPSFFLGGANCSDWEESHYYL